MLVLFIILCAWLVVSAFAVVLCMAARRMDRELSADHLAPVIELAPAALARRSHNPAA